MKFPDETEWTTFKTLESCYNSSTNHMQECPGKDTACHVEHFLLFPKSKEA